jgi:hypothetical protein
MRIEITISLDDDAITDVQAVNLSAPLSDVGRAISDAGKNGLNTKAFHNANGKIIDYNGNTIGDWFIAHDLSDVDSDCNCRVCGYQMGR